VPTMLGALNSNKKNAIRNALIGCRISCAESCYVASHAAPA
jgi:hypothetical protein